MPKAVAYKPVTSQNDIYQASQTTNYQRDQTTGALFLKSGSNVRTIIQEQFKTATVQYNEGTTVAGSTSLYTVPAGKVFLLTSLALQISHDAGTLAVDGWLRLGGVAVLKGYGAAVAGSYITSISFPVLIIIAAGTTIAVQTSAATVRATGSFFGYEINVSEYYPAT